MKKIKILIMIAIAYEKQEEREKKLYKQMDRISSNIKASGFFYEHTHWQIKNKNLFTSVCKYILCSIKKISINISNLLEPQHNIK